MKKVRTVPCLAFLAMAVVSCVGSGSEQDETGLLPAEEVGESEATLVTGEVYRTTPDASCRRHDDEATGQRFYFCLRASHYDGDLPNIWRFQVCKLEVSQHSAEVATSPFQNETITWRVEGPNDQFTPDITFTTEGRSCTDHVEIDMKMVPCNLPMVVDAEIVSPAGCTDPKCIYPTGGFVVSRQCPAEPGGF